MERIIFTELLTGSSGILVNINTNFEIKRKNKGG